MYLILAAGLVIGFLSISRLELILDTVRAIGSQIPGEEHLPGNAFKNGGDHIHRGICLRDLPGTRDFRLWGTQVEMFGKLSILAVSAPVLQALLETLQVFLS